VIAIVPQIAASGTQLAPSPSGVTPAGHAAEQSFSAVFEQAKSFTTYSPGDQAATAHVAPQGSYTPIRSSSDDVQSMPSSLPVSLTGPAEQSLAAILEQAKSFTSRSLGDPAATTHAAPQRSGAPVSTSKRDAKKSDSKSTDSRTSGWRSRGNDLTQTPASSSNPPEETVPAVMVPTLTLSLPVFAWDADIQNVTPDAQVGSATNDSTESSATSALQSAISAGASGGATFLPTLSRNVSGDATEVKALKNTGSQDSLNPVATSLASTNPVSTKSGSAGANHAEPGLRAPGFESGPVAGLAAKLSGPASDAKTSPANVPAPAQAHNITRGTVETSDATGKTLAAVKSEIEQVLATPASVSAIVPPVTGSGNFDSASLQGTAGNAAPDKSRIGSTQAGVTQVGSNQVGLNGDSSGTTTKSVDAPGSAKSQTRKDDSQSSSSSTMPDQATVSAPAKAIDSSQVFSVSGTQTSPATGNGKTVTAGVPQDPSDQTAGQLDHTSTGVAQSQQGESAATYPTSSVHSGKLVERVGEAELRLGIRAGEFGSVDVRTSMVRNQFTAEISTERGELSRAMAAELPSLQNRLSEQRVPVANITLQNQTGNQSTASEQQRPRDGQRTYVTNTGSGRNEGPMAAMVALEGTVTTSGLDIHM
jgi:flagellar hook-length control protein FliK